MYTKVLVTLFLIALVLIIRNSVIIAVNRWRDYKEAERAREMKLLSELRKRRNT